MIRRKFDFAYLIIIFPLLRMVFPWLQYRCNVLWTAPFIMIWFIIIFTRVDISSRFRTKLSIAFIWLAICVISYKLIMPIIYGISFEGSRLFVDFKVVISTLVTVFFVSSMVCYSFAAKKFLEFKVIFFLIVIAQIWTAIASCIGADELRSIGSGRLMMALGTGKGESLDTYQIESVAELGMAGRNCIYSACMVIAPLLYSLFKISNKKMKFLIVILILAEFLIIKNGGLTTPFLLLFCGIVLLLLFVVFRSRKVIIYASCFFTMLMIFFSFNQKLFSFSSPILRALAVSCENYPVFSNRFISMAEAVEGKQDAYATLRYELQQRSMRTFLDGNWLFGQRVSKKTVGIGGHSELLDALAVYGLLGFGILIAYMVLYWRVSYLIGQHVLGFNWLTMVVLYLGTWLFATVPNPIAIFDPIIVLLFPGLALFYDEYKSRNAILLKAR